MSRNISKDCDIRLGVVCLDEGYFLGIWSIDGIKVVIIYWMS